MDTASLVKTLGRKARAAALALATTTPAQREVALRAMADALDAAETVILTANAEDVAAAEKNALTSASIDRLRLDPKRLRAISDALRHVAGLPDPVGTVISKWTRPNGIEITKLRTPIGVIGIIYESRPNVTADAASLCIKTGNAVILRGGSESLRSNIAIAAALAQGARAVGLPEDCIQLVPIADREVVTHMAAMDDCIDVIIPRGGHALIATVVQHARMPVIKHYNGICTVYVHSDADLAMAARIVENAKCQRPGVCNAMETLLLHRDIAESFWRAALPSLAKHNVKIHADPANLKLLNAANYANAVPAVDADWTTEYLDYEMAVREVATLDEAIAHINTNSSHHSDAIVTIDSATAERFLAEVDSATVYWNASTRFTDGGEFGFGAEIGISTDKLHARGPMALEELTTYKYTIRGTGQVRS